MESLQVNVDEALIVSKQDDLRPSTSGIRRARTGRNLIYLQTTQII